MIDTIAPARTVPTEPTTPIKPSEAIRLGCLLAPIQEFGCIGNGDRAYVMGAMVRGYGGGRIDPRSPWMVGPCPACGHTPTDGSLSTPAHLNDDHRWTRERIADWLEGQGL